MDWLGTLGWSAIWRMFAGISSLAWMIPASVSAQDGPWTVHFQNNGRAIQSGAVPLPSDQALLLVTVTGHEKDLSKSEVRWGDRRIPVEWVRYDPVSRLCFLRLAENSPSPAPVWKKSAGMEPGTVVTGASGSTKFRGRMEGWVNRIGGKILPLALMKVGFEGSIPSPGTSLLDERGKVVAIVFQQSETEPCVYALPAEAVHRVAKDVERDGKLVRGWLGLSLRVENESPKIVRVIPDSPAGLVGMKENDLILKIRGRDISNYAEAVNALFYIVPGDPVDIEVQRGQSVVAFTVAPVAEKPGN